MPSDFEAKIISTGTLISPLKKLTKEKRKTKTKRNKNKKSANEREKFERRKEKRIIETRRDQKGKKRKK